MKLTEVLYVSRLDRKLMSISALTTRGVVVQFLDDRATLVVNETMVASVPRVGKLFAWAVTHVIDKEEGRGEGEEANQGVGGDGGDDLWPTRLGHVSHAKLELVAKTCSGLPSRFGCGGGVCAGCTQGKMA